MKLTRTKVRVFSIAAIFTAALIAAFIFAGHKKENMVEIKLKNPEIFGVEFDEFKIEINVP